MSIRQVCTSFRGGSASITSPSTMTSGHGKPICADAAFISSVANVRKEPPARSSYSAGAE
jgi:hypothetical protein